jgi:hemerythrin superfamily protein
MTIYEAIKKDHKNVLGLLDQLIAAEKSAPESREALLTEIRDELIPHSRAEEAVLYNSIRDIEGEEGIVAHSYGEHMQAEALLRGLQVSDALNVDWVAGAKKLKEALTHHINEEEGKIFTAAQHLFIEVEAEAMAEVFNKMKPLIKKQSFLGNSVDLMVNMMPARLRGAFAKFAAPVSMTA